MIPVGFQALPISVAQLSLAAVLKCGQSFRWSILPLPLPQLSATSSTTAAMEPANSRTHEYRLCLRDRVVCLQQSPDTLFYRSVFPGSQPTPTHQAIREAETLVWLRDYFQLDVDLENLYQQWALKDTVFARFQDRFGGIRMLRQDPWENLISFICSSNNNITRITKMVQNLCKHYSPPLLTLPDPSDASKMHAYHPFPPPSVLADAGVSSMLRSLGFGYRADFIQRTSKILVDAHGILPLSINLREPSEVWLQALRNLETEAAREELLKFVGVGRKVADCILLMSLDKKEVIPVDTHVHQIAIKHYGLKGSSTKTAMTPKVYEEVNTKLQSLWGDYAGWAHSVLFTADLKIFSTYGLDSSPSSSPIKAKKGPVKLRVQDSSLPTPSVTPSPSPLKRKMEVTPIMEDLFEEATLAERVKRRRRTPRP